MRRLIPALAVPVALAVALAGCTPPAAEPTAWQQSVRTVADQASTGDYSAALASLDALEADVIARRDAGEITTEEADGILSRIATVRADLSSLAPTPAPEETSEPVQTSEPVETTAPVETVQPTQGGSDDAGTDDGADDEKGPADKGSENKGPGGKDDKTPAPKDTGGPGKKDG
jgi:hypothetical protein